MRQVLRSVVAVLAGFIVASVVMMAVEFANGHLFHPDLARAAEGVTDRESLRALLEQAPVTALLVVVAGWILGAVAGGWIAARLATRARLGHGLTLGVLLTMAGVASNLMLPPPLWFWVVSLPVFLPAVYLGARLALER